MQVLISAYACEPNKGSEPEVGWQWATRMARFHDVTVLTRANNRDSIEAALAKIVPRTELPKFVYLDCSRPWLLVKRLFRATQLYYVAWQATAQRLVARLVRDRHFAVLHHVTFAAFRYPTAIWGHGVASVWGPMGGVEVIPAGLLPWGHPVSLVRETTRNAATMLQTSPFARLNGRARSTTRIISSTRQMHNLLADQGHDSTLMPAIGIDSDLVPSGTPEHHHGPLRVLYVGNLLGLKGLDLGLEALKVASAAPLHLTLVGTGDYEDTLRRKSAALGLASSVTFRGRLPRKEVLQLYPAFDLFLFPSLHDTGGYAVIEAMLNRLPVVCLDTGGPAIAVEDGCGWRVPLGPRQKVIAGLAKAITFYHTNRAVLREHGANARASVVRNYDWRQKCQRMSELYYDAAAIHHSLSTGLRNPLRPTTK
jgi:glycosyltransferase involved in cell wall biosynthesis